MQENKLKINKGKKLMRKIMTFNQILSIKEKIIKTLINQMT